MRYQETSGVNGDPLEWSHGGEWVFNPLEARASLGPGSPQTVSRSPCCAEFSGRLLVPAAPWVPGLPTRRSAGGAGLRLCLLGAGLTDDVCLA